ncbi:MAG: winged helix-turn-helix domain-containing protein [Desulfonatronovibrionaceae bacterium]
MQEIKAVLRIHPWFEVDKGVVFGPGRLMLFKYVKELGSLNKAAERLGMSYRAAWGKVKATEEALGRKLLHRSRGRRGFSLTPDAEEIMHAFEKWFDEIEDYAYQRARDRFPWQSEKFGSCKLEKEG